MSATLAPPQPHASSSASTARPEVSIILPTCDRPHLVQSALNSVLRQSFTNLEVLLVDANRESPRVTANPNLKEMLADPRVRVIPAVGSRTASMSRNAGLAEARGEWITFLDDDDTYLPEKVAAQHALACTTGAPLVLCGYELVWPDRRRPRQIDHDRFCGDEMLTHTTLGSPMLFHRRDHSLRFDERLSAGEDMRYAVGLMRKYEVTELPCVPRALILVTQRADARSVHSNKEAVWRAYRATCHAARGKFSREARHAFLAKGRIERTLGGHGGVAYFVRSVLSLLRTRCPRKWRLAAFAIISRFQLRP